MKNWVTMVVPPYTSSFSGMTHGDASYVFSFDRNLFSVVDIVVKEGRDA